MIRRVVSTGMMFMLEQSLLDEAALKQTVAARLLELIDAQLAASKNDDKGYEALKSEFEKRAIGASS